MSLGEKQGIFYLLLILLFASSAVFSLEVRAWKMVARLVRTRVKKLKRKCREWRSTDFCITMSILRLTAMWCTNYAITIQKFRIGTNL